MFSITRVMIGVIMLFALLGSASAQGNPTGGIDGRVTDQDGLAELHQRADQRVVRRSQVFAP